MVHRSECWSTTAQQAITRYVSNWPMYPPLVPERGPFAGISSAAAG
jgi:hypothetical protein